MVEPPTTNPSNLCPNPLSFPTFCVLHTLVSPWVYDPCVSHVFSTVFWTCKNEEHGWSQRLPARLRKEKTTLKVDWDRVALDQLPPKGGSLFAMAMQTYIVDGRNPANQLIWSIFHCLQGFIHVRWLAGFLPSTCFEISLEMVGCVRFVQ